ncbi:MAG: CBS domain-containing protein [Syntrophobacteraceae bacterium]|nr:CBS domain-containing protein [Syntrophobacteraceae bacterium]
MKNVRDILREKGTTVYSIGPDESVYDALKLMADKNVGALLVMEADQMVGIISERDYSRKGILQNRFSRDTRVREIMTVEIKTVTLSTDLQECMELFTEKRIRHLPVIENDRVAGIISIGDAVKGVIDHHQAVIEQLESYIKGQDARREQV